MPWRRAKNNVRRRATLALLADLPPGRVLDATLQGVTRG